MKLLNKNKIPALIKNAKIRYYQNKLKLNQNNTAKVWHLANECQNKPSNSEHNISSLKIKDNVLQSPMQIANELNKHFINVSANLLSKIKVQKRRQVTMLQKI